MFPGSRHLLFAFLEDEYSLPEIGDSRESSISQWYLVESCNCIAQNIQNKVNCSVTDFNVIFIEIFYFRVYIRKNTYLTTLKRDKIFVGNILRVRKNRKHYISWVHFMSYVAISIWSWQRFSNLLLHLYTLRYSCTASANYSKARCVLLWDGLDSTCLKKTYVSHWQKMRRA